MSLHVVPDQGDSSMPETPPLATVQADDAHRVATRVDTAIAQHRRAGVREAIECLTDDRDRWRRYPGVDQIRRDRAWWILLHSVYRQARCAGLDVSFAAMAAGRRGGESS